MRDPSPALLSASLLVSSTFFLAIGQPALADDEAHAPPPDEAAVVVAALPEGVTLPAASVQSDGAVTETSEPIEAGGPKASNLLAGGAVPQGGAVSPPAAPAAALAVPAGEAARTPQTETGSVETGSVTEGGGSPRPAGWRRADAPAGWTPVGGARVPGPQAEDRSDAPQDAGGSDAGGSDAGGSAGTTASPVASQPPSGWSSAEQTSEAPTSPAADRRLAVGASLFGAAIISGDVLVRLGPDWIFDGGIGVRETYVAEEARLLVVSGLSWQPGDRRSRHGVYLRGGGVLDEAEGGEVLGSVGYGWRFVPRAKALSLSVEVGPVWMAALAPEPGEPAAWLLPYLRLGGHFWLKNGS